MNVITLSYLWRVVGVCLICRRPRKQPYFMGFLNQNSEHWAWPIITHRVFIAKESRFIRLAVLRIRTRSTSRASFFERVGKIMCYLPSSSWKVDGNYGSRVQCLRGSTRGRVARLLTQWTLRRNRLLLVRKPEQGTAGGYALFMNNSRRLSMILLVNFSPSRLFIPF